MNTPTPYYGDKLPYYRDMRVTHDFDMLVKSFECRLLEAAMLSNLNTWTDCGSEAADIAYEESRYWLYESGRQQR